MFAENHFLELQENIVAIDDEGGKLTYEQLDKLNQELKTFIPERCLVFCLCSNTLGSLIGYTTFIKNKVVPLLLDLSLDAELLDKLIELYLPAYLWLPVENSLNFPEFENIFKSHEYVLVKTNFSKSYKLHDELALLFTTSGTTGSPKLVRISYDNIRSNTESIIEYLSIRSSDRPIVALPMNYSFGLSIVNSHLMKGATLLLSGRSVMEKEFWSFFKNEKATSLSGVPYTFEILHKLRFTRMNLPDLKTITQAGGKLSVDLTNIFAQYAKDNGKSFFVMYGQAEASPRMSYLPSEWTLKKPGSIGIPIPGGKFFLISENNTEVKQSGETGELVYEGKNVSLGYALLGDDLEKGDENNGVLHTGDLAQFDEDGFYYVVGRKKRFIKLFGNRVNLDDIEQMLKLVVVESACVGVDDKIDIFITESSKTEEVVAFLSQKTFVHHSAFKVHVIIDIPKNTSGKILYSKLEINK